GPGPCVPHGSDGPVPAFALQPEIRPLWTTKSPVDNRRDPQWICYAPASEGAPEMLDNRGAGPLRENAHDVEAHRPAYGRMLGQPRGGQVPQAPDLGRGERRHRRTERGRPAGLHLTEHDHVAFAGHDVDLAAGTAPVAIEY